MMFLSSIIEGIQKSGTSYYIEKPMKTICVCTTVHPAWDGRIYEKEISTLLKKYKVIYVAPFDETPSNNPPSNFIYFPLKNPRNRLIRFFRLIFVFKQLFVLRKQVISYHIHDPELTIVLLLLKIFTSKYCIYDVHENYPAAIRHRFWIPKPLRKIFASLFTLIEKVSMPFFDANIYASQEIGEVYHGRESIVLNNFPSQKHYQSIPDFSQKKPFILLAGGLTKVRGIVQTVEAFILAELPQEYQLIILGWFESEMLQQSVLDKLKSSSKKNNFQYHPWVPYTDSIKFMQESSIGIIPYLDFENHRHGFPNKIYEFMATATPFIYNKLPNYLRVIGHYQIGFAVDSSNPDEIAHAMEKLAHNSNLRKEMGLLGRELFINQFNWEKQEHALFSLYGKI